MATFQFASRGAAHVPHALLALSILSLGAAASDLKFDGQTSVQKEIGTSLTIELKGNPGLPALVFMDSTAGPTQLLGETIDLGFTPDLFLAASGTTDAAGLFSAQLPVAYMSSWIGAQVFGAGVILDPADPNGFDVSAGASATLIPSQAFFIQSCSLGCTSTGPMKPIDCTAFTMSQNEHIEVLFSQPVDLASVTATTFQMQNLTTGQNAPGKFSIDPTNPNLLIFDPQFALLADGTPEFGFADGMPYWLHIPGLNHDIAGSYLKSTTGEENANRWSCVPVVTGFSDDPLGPPTATLTVDKVTSKDPVTGAVTGTAPVVIDALSTEQGIWLETDLVFDFDDIILPSTIIDLLAGSSPSISVTFDLDGNVATIEDQLDIDGTFSLSIDPTAKTTRVVFDPTNDLPPGGSGVLPRLILVDISSAIADLPGNGITNPGLIQFAPDTVLLSALTLPGGGEDFSTPAHLDTSDSGANWGTGTAMLTPGQFGSSGHLGRLLVKSGEVKVLDTATADLTSNEVVVEGAASFPPIYGAPTSVVMGGIFEFSSVSIEDGGSLRFTGSNVARLFARGDLVVMANGEIDASADLPSSGHDSSLLMGSLPATATLGAGTGGRGGDRPDDQHGTLIALGGSANPGAVIDGSPGAGVGGVAGVGSGQAGLAWPQTNPQDWNDLTALVLDSVCKVDMVAGQGSGGGYGTAGGDSVVRIVDPFLNPGPPPGILAPTSVGGLAVALSAAERSLNPELGYLRGGSGGGGGGRSFLRSQSDGAAFGECKVGHSLKFYWPHSAASGGPGGGALQIQAGGLLSVHGGVRVSGGDGEGGISAPFSFKRADQAAAGGGGSGGALLLQGATLDLQPATPLLFVQGGQGGASPGGFPGSFGGEGGAGIVRLEGDVIGTAASLAPTIFPYDPTPGSSTGGPDSTAILSVANRVQNATGPETRSGAVSKWIQPAGQYFGITFVADDLSNPASPIYGWDFDVVLNTPGVQPFSFRDATDPGNPFGVSIESIVGSDLGGASASPIVVRFQGVHAKGPLAQLDDVDLSDASQVDPDSVTPWLRSTAELESYWANALPGQSGLAATRQPNMVRFQVIFDTNAPLASMVTGITNFGIDVVLD